MISVENLQFYGDIPDEWIFEYYLSLQESLVGQDIKILSVFNSSDKVPSMCVYVDEVTMTYKFKDFSSGYQGNAISMVMKLYNLSYVEAIAKVQADYVDTPKVKRELIHHEKFKVTDYEIRHWNKEDAKYWLQFKITSDILEKYEVAPLEYYVMSRNTPEGVLETFKSSKLFLYGYFSAEGDLIKIYQPKIKDKKFIKVRNHLQGYDQLTFNTKYLLIVSSLKDLMAFNRLGIKNIEAVAPDSENSMISKPIMQQLMSSYTKVIVLFDNDEPGKKSAENYHRLYELNNINLDLSKDLSDSIKEHGIVEVRSLIYKLLKQVI